ncbi:EVE domain-containing protein [bacterium]|nr:MAG: EVE domain-containing protein [bacterium]
MSYWILKSEPTTYSFDNLVKDKKATWDGIRNPQALLHIRSMKKKDLAMIYHSNEGKCIVGLAEIISEPYPDPKLKEAKFAVIDLIPKYRLKKPVTLSEIKANPKLSELKLVRQSRLSVIPVPEAMWYELLKMAGEK